MKLLELSNHDRRPKPWCVRTPRGSLPSKTHSLMGFWQRTEQPAGHSPLLSFQTPGRGKPCHPRTEAKRAQGWGLPSSFLLFFSVVTPMSRESFGPEPPFCLRLPCNLPAALISRLHLLSLLGEAWPGRQCPGRARGHGLGAGTLLTGLGAMEEGKALGHGGFLL